MTDRNMGFVCVSHSWRGDSCMPLAMVDEPAKCDRCGKIVVCPTIGQVFNDCECGGRVHTIEGAPHTTRESLRPKKGGPQ